MSEEGPGAVDKAKGLAKEAVGAVTGNEKRKAEGRGDQREKRRGSVGHLNRIVTGDLYPPSRGPGAKGSGLLYRF